MNNENEKDVEKPGQSQEPAADVSHGAVGGVPIELGLLHEADVSDGGKVSTIGVLDQQEMAEKEASLSLFLTEEITELFESYDGNGNGYISREEIKSAYKSFAIEVDFDDCRAIIDAFDVTGYGHIKFHDFHREMYEIMLHGTLEEHLKLVFEAIDTDRDGFIGPEEITTQFQRLGALITPEEAEEAIAKIDKNGYGLVDFPQFQIFCSQMDKLQMFAQTPIKRYSKI